MSDIIRAKTFKTAFAAACVLAAFTYARLDFLKQHDLTDLSELRDVDVFALVTRVVLPGQPMWSEVHDARP